MPDYVPIQDLTITGSIGDSDLFPMSDGSYAYAVRGSTIKSYAASDAVAAKTAAQSAATAAGNAQTAAQSAAGNASASATAAEAAAAAAATAASEASAVGDQIEDVADSVGQITGVTPLTEWVPGYIVTNQSTVDITDVTPSDEYWCQVVSCVPGDTFHIKTEGASTSARPWCWVKSDGTKISAASVNVVDTDIIAPSESAMLVCNCRYSIGKLTKGQSYIKALQDMVPWGLNTEGADSVPENADFNAYITPGTYRVNNNTAATTISNMPVQQAGRLVVMKATTNNLYVQIYFARGSKAGTVFSRTKYNTEQWQDWICMSNSVVDNKVDYLSDSEIVFTPELLATRVVDYTDGTIDSNSFFHGIANLEIPDGTTGIRINFYNSIAGNDGYAFYDNSGEFISGGKNAESGAFFYSPLTIYPIPTGAKYFACCGRISYEESGVDRTITFINGKIKSTTNRNYGQTVVMLGDSVIGNYNGPDSVPTFLERFSGAKCYNCGFGGSSMGRDTVAPVFADLSAFDGWKIVHAIAINNYSDQLEAIASDPTYERLKSYFSSHIATLQSMDWSKVDMITLSYGTNDWGMSVTLNDNPNNLKDTTTFGGAYRTALEELWSVYPHIKVVLCGCIWRGLSIVDGELVSDTDDGAGSRLAPLKDYEEKIKSVAEEYHVPFIPMYDNTSFNKYTWKQYFHTTDATHPARKGRYVIAKRYAEFLAGV